MYSGMITSLLGLSDSSGVSAILRICWRLPLVPPNVARTLLESILAF